MKERMKEFFKKILNIVKTIASFILVFGTMGCFVSGFISEFSILFGEDSFKVGFVVSLVLLFMYMRDEDKTAIEIKSLKSVMEILERENAKLREKLDHANEELKYYKEKEEAGK